jgi:hypothetical protein
MKHEYHEGPNARKRFDEGMTKLFNAYKKTAQNPKIKPKREKAKAGKD